MVFYSSQLSLCGCWYVIEANQSFAEREYMPQINLTAHTTILSTTSKTVLTQTFRNAASESIDQASYTFPLYDGVSVVGFNCRVGSRVIHGLVKEKEKARAEYKEAISRGETAGLLEQLPEASDVFTTRIGNIPAKEKVIVELTYLGELKHDAEVDGVRFTIPTVVAPRYGFVQNSPAGLPSDSNHKNDMGRIEITIDVSVDEGSFIRGIQSPSHPIGVTLGRTSAMAEDATDPHRASATMSLHTNQLEKDFVLLVLAKGQDIPRALLETHPKFPNQRAVMATLVPRFNLPPIRPEIVFVVDRSGSMQGKIDTVVSALKVFLKSLPVGVKFNICSFGSKFSFLWPRSKSYDQSSLDEALTHVSSFSSNFGGTEMLHPVVETVKNRYKDMQLEVMLLTDGEIWNEQELFGFINETVAKDPVRFFSLGVGPSASHSLVEGIARAGNGFAQSVGENEKLDKKVVRMLKGALTPHINDYTLEVKYESASSGEDFEMVEKVTDGLRVMVTDPDREKNTKTSSEKPTISLFDPSAMDVDEEKPSSDPTGEDRYNHLPTIESPKLLQSPNQIPPLYTFTRTTVYLLMSPEACQNTPKSVVLRGTSEHGPLELEIPVEDVGKGETIHQLAARKAVTELEEGRGWIVEAKADDGEKLKERYDGRWDELVQREAVRLGVRFQVGGKWCSFVAVKKNAAQVSEGKNHDADYEIDYDLIDYGEAAVLDDAVPEPSAFGFRPAMSGAAKMRVMSSGSMRSSSGGGLFLTQAGPAMAFAGFGSSAQQQLCFGSSAPQPQMSSQLCSIPQGLRYEGVTGFSSAAPPPINPAPSFVPHPAKVSPDLFAACPMAAPSQDPFDTIKHLKTNAAWAEAPKPQPRFETPENRMHALIALQTFDGSWLWNDELLGVLDLQGESGNGQKMATVLAIAFFENKVPGEIEAWELVVEKARGWLEERAVDVDKEVQRVASMFGQKWHVKE